jgi:hypothetical protein
MSDAEPDVAHPRQTPDVLKLLVAIASPIALATSLLFYFGWVRSQEQASAFGADASVFDMSTHDYVLRSVDVLFFPVLLVLLVGLLTGRLDRRVRTSVIEHQRLRPIARGLQLSWLLFIPLGFLLLGVAGEFGDVTLPFWVGLAILGPVYGTVLRRVSVGDQARFSGVAVTLIALLLTVVLFWQTERIARYGGQALAQHIKDNLGTAVPQVTLLSVKNLDLGGQGVVMQPVPGANNAYGFACSGLYLLQRSGGKYFLLTAGWDTGAGRLIVLPDNDSLRIEFGS